MRLPGADEGDTDRTTPGRSAGWEEGKGAEGMWPGLPGFLLLWGEGRFQLRWRVDGPRGAPVTDTRECGLHRTGVFWDSGDGMGRGVTYTAVSPGNTKAGK